VGEEFEAVYNQIESGEEVKGRTSKGLKHVFQGPYSL
jgi:hypothetical protein